MKKEKRIPTLLGLFLLLVGLGGGLLLTGNIQTFGSKANSSCQPQNPQVTNITNTSLDISFTTESNCFFDLLIDKRTIPDMRENSKIHYFQVNNLAESTEYSFSFLNGDKLFEKPTNKIKTAPQPPSSVPASNLAWGKVLDSSKKPAASAIVYLNITNASPLSALVTSSGNWNIPLASCLNNQKTDWFSPGPNIAEDIVVISVDGIQTQILGNTSLNNPVPDIIIGQNQFNQKTLSEVTPAGELPQVSREPDEVPVNLEISNPKDGELIYTAVPQFFGKGPINSLVQITIESLKTINGQVSTDTRGTWQYSPPENLTPGEHTITLRVQNPITGLWQTITRRFVISGDPNSKSALAFTASGSATKTPTPNPTATITIVMPTTSLLPTSQPSLAPSKIPTLSPTLTLPAPSVTIFPTAIPTTRTAKPSVTGPLNKAGNTTPTSILIIASLLSLVSGFYLIFKK